MRRFLAWLQSRIDLKLLETRVSEGLREAALLWFVFSLLDIANQATANDSVARLE